MNNLSNSSKTKTMLARLRQQQETDEAEINQLNQQQEPLDLYTPLAYEEADENQLADFFTTLDIDVSFGGCDNVINNMSEVSTNRERQSAKRRRLSNGGDSFSSSYSDEIYNHDGTGLQRKGSGLIDSTRQVAPIE